MESLETFNKYIVNCLHTLIIFAPTINLVGKQYSDFRFVDNQVIRDVKLNLENLRPRPRHPFFSLYHCETLDTCGPFFCREDLDSFFRPTSDSVLIAPLLAMFQSFSSRIKPPPEFLLSGFQWYRRLPNVIQWIFLLPCFVCSKMLKVCKTGCVHFWTLVWSGWCWIASAILTCCCLPCTCLKKICCPEKIRPESQNNSYGAVESQTTQPNGSPSLKDSQTQQATISNRVGNNEERAPSPSPPVEPTPTLGNNEPIPSVFSLENEFESLKKNPETAEAATVSECDCQEDGIAEYKREMEVIADNRSFEEQLGRIDRELKKKKEEQREQILKNEEPRVFDSDNEEFREVNDQFKKERDEQARLHREELEEMRRKRREKQKKMEEEFLEMKKESQQRQAALLTCIMMKIRFDEKEGEWGDFLKGIRRYIINVSTSAFDLQNEFQRSSETDEERSENIVTEVKFLANLVNTAQNVLANAYYFLEEQSEKYDDRIFLKMIMKSVLIEGQNCDSIGNNLSNLMRSPIDNGIQEACRESIKKLNAHSIPTTQMLKTSSVSAREEDYSNLGRFPEPDWFSTI